jgi:hypothetical protein
MARRASADKSASLGPTCDELRRTGPALVTGGWHGVKRGRSMKAIRVHEFGVPSVLKLEEIPDPKPGPGELLVRIRAAGVNPVDAYIRDVRAQADPAVHAWTGRRRRNRSGRRRRRRLQDRRSGVRRRCRQHHRGRRHVCGARGVYSRASASSARARLVSARRRPWRAVLHRVSRAVSEGRSQAGRRCSCGATGGVELRPSSSRMPAA